MTSPNVTRPLLSMSKSLKASWDMASGDVSRDSNALNSAREIRLARR